MLDHLDLQIAKTSAELFDEVRSDFGSCGNRRLLRQLSLLVRLGCVSKGREWDMEIGWWRPVYLRTKLRKSLAVTRVPGRPRCPECGMVGKTIKTHPDHQPSWIRLYNSRVANGLCPKCGRFPPKSGKKHCSACCKILAANTLQRRKAQRLRNVTPAREPGGEHGCPTGGAADTVDGQTRAA